MNRRSESHRAIRRNCTKDGSESEEIAEVPESKGTIGTKPSIGIAEIAAKFAFAPLPCYYGERAGVRGITNNCYLKT